MQTIPIKPKKQQQSAKTLPWDQAFFENWFNLEVSFRQYENSETVKEILTQYTRAIEYYQSKKDSRHSEYQLRLKLFMMQPHVIDLLNSDNSSKKKVEKKDLSKKDIKFKVEFLTQINTILNEEETKEKAKNIINIPKKDNKEKETKNWINSSINQQQNNFKEKLKIIKLNKSKGGLKNCGSSENWRRKEKLGSITINTPSFEHVSWNTENSLSNNPSFNNEKESSEAIPFENLVKDCAFPQLNEKEDDVKEDENKIKETVEIKPVPVDEDLKKKDEKVNENIENWNNSDDSVISNDDSNEDITNNSSKLMELLESNKNIGPKQEQGLINIKKSLDKYSTEFNTYFYEEVFTKFSKRIQRLMEDKYKNYIKINQNYNSQIRDLEVQLCEYEEDDPNIARIQGIIESLKEEQENELARIEDFHNNLILNEQSDFKNGGFKSDPGIKLIEEKFRLEMCNKITEVIMPTK